MLYTIEGKRVTEVPHYRSYISYVKQMNKRELDQIVACLMNVVEKEEIVNSSYIPPKHWKGSVFQPIFDLIKDKQLSAYFYGQILWKVMMDDDQKWMFQKADNTLGTIYFLVEDQDRLA